MLWLMSPRLIRYGRLLVRNYFKRDTHTKIVDNGRNCSISSELKPGGTFNRQELKQLSYNQNLRTNSIFRFGSQARRLFVDNVLNRVTNPCSAELRAQAAKRLIYGDSAPFFALVGVSLASGDGMLTKDDELEAVCWEIRNAVSQFQSKVSEQDVTKRLENAGLDTLDIGPPLAKGCSAVVYAAAMKEEMQEMNSLPTEKEFKQVPDDVITESDPPVPSSENIGRFIHNFGGSVDNLHTNFNETQRSNATNSVGLLRKNLLDLSTEDCSLRQTDCNSGIEQGRERKRERVRFDSENIGIQRSRLLSDAVDEYLEQTTTSDIAAVLHDNNIDATMEQYPLALKMMFNYGIQSNAMAILKAMYKETVPAKKRSQNDVENWEKTLMDQTIVLPPHPNIVEMYSVFCDQIPELNMSSSLYPMALPSRLNPHGYGRNMSLFLLMKRYNCCLRDYLSQDNIDMRTRILLVTQLLEAVAHLNRYGIAHRDLKSDNILIELRENMPAILVLSDFGCCIADKSHGLHIPYTSNEIDKGGNTTLMAPEIISKQPGTFSVLNYSKSDLWACGAIAYEIFDSGNPFYGKKCDNVLRNEDYKEEDLPELSRNVPLMIRKLIGNILRRNPNERLNPDVAANVMQLHLWAPSSWTKTSYKPSSNEILQWLLSLTTKILCEGRLHAGSDTMGRRTYTEYLLISSFLMRARINSLKRALDWIHIVQ